MMPKMAPPVPKDKLNSLDARRFIKILRFKKVTEM
jgi:hypothetical protein